MQPLQPPTPLLKYCFSFQFLIGFGVWEARRWTGRAQITSDWLEGSIDWPSGPAESDPEGYPSVNNVSEQRGAHLGITDKPSLPQAPTCLWV